MNKKDSLGDRMKGYENVWKTKLPRRMPLILRIDGKAFHTYTAKCQKPFDDKLISLMNETMIHLCKNIQGAQFGYVQSDEISILVHDYKALNSEAWFDRELQKMCSIASGMASAYFTMNSWKIFGPELQGEFKDGKALIHLGSNPILYTKMAVFDCRAFVLSEAEVNNYFVWREQDATRNSIQMLARSLYSHKECENKNTSMLQEMTFQKGQNWNDIKTGYKRGRATYKIQTEAPTTSYATESRGEGPVTPIRNTWFLDEEIPIFSKDPSFIEKWLAVTPSVN